MSDAFERATREQREEEIEQSIAFAGSLLPFSELFWCIQPAFIAEFKSLRAELTIQELAERALAAGREQRDAVRHRIIDQIGVVEIRGPLTRHWTPWTAEAGGTATDAVSKLLRCLAERGDVDAVLLIIDSPGGTVWAGGALQRTVASLRERTPVWVYIDREACGAAAPVAFAADRVLASASARIGNTVVTDPGTAWMTPGDEYADPDSNDPEHQEYLQSGMQRTIFEGMARQSTADLAALAAIDRGAIFSAEGAEAVGLVHGIVADVDAALGELREFLKTRMEKKV